MKTFFNGEKQNKDIKYNYSLLDANKVFSYAIILSPFISIFTFVLFLFISGLGGIDYDTLINSSFAGYYSIVIISISILILFLIYNKRNNIKPIYELGVKNKINIWFVLISVLLGVGCIFLLAPFMNILFDVFGVQDQEMPFKMNSWYTIILGIVGYAFVPAVCEELIYRGVIQKGAEKRFTPFVAILISTSAFTLMHGSLQQTFYQVILGVVAGVLFYYGKNIIYSMVFHFLNNLTVCLFDLFGMPAYMNTGYWGGFWGVALPILLFLAWCGIFVGLFFLIKHISKKHESKVEFIMEGQNIIYEEEHKKYGLKNLFSAQNHVEKMYFSFAFIVAIIIWISNTIEGF